MTDFVAPLLPCEDSLEDIAKVNTRGNGSLPLNFLKGAFEIKKQPPRLEFIELPMKFKDVA